MIYSYGGRIDNDSNAITVIDEENETAVTTGYVNGEYVEFNGGGGGSSDFSTATVAVVTNSGKTISLPYIEDDGEFHSIMNLGISASGSYTVPLYKGSLTGRVSDAESVNVSGDITYYPSRMVVVTGDGTITIS